MKTLGLFEAHYALPERTVATFWKVTRRDDEVFGFTDHDQSRQIDSVIYHAESGFTASQIATNAMLSVDNMEVNGLFDSSAITDAALEAGIWDDAEIEIFEANYLDTSMRNTLLTGWIGTVRRHRGLFVAELRSLTAPLQKTVGAMITPNCRYKLGDLNCKVDIEAITEHDVPVTSVTSRRVLVATSLIADTRQFNWGVLTFTTGLNAGFAQDVKTFTAGSGTIELQLPFPFVVSPLDEFSIKPGCNKLLKTGPGEYLGDCIVIYDNADNNGGEPEVPLAQKSFRIPGT